LLQCGGTPLCAIGLNRSRGRCLWRSSRNYQQP
jgi:hypothetical protein